MRTEKNSAVRKRLLADDVEGVTYVEAAEDVNGPPAEKKPLIVQGVTIVGTAVNNKLESILGDRE